MAYVNLKNMALEVMSHLKKNEFDAAETKLNYLLNIDPNDAILIYYLGCLYLGQNKYGFAITAYERALALLPEFDQCLNNISTAYRQVGDIEKCIVNFKKAIEIAKRPDYHKAFETKELAMANLSDYLGNLGSCYIAKGRAREALPIFEEALKYPSDDRNNVLWNQGLAYLELGDYEKGFIGYDYGERISPKKERCYHGTPGSTPWWPGPGTKKANGELPTVVVYGEQGIGDEIMFASIIPDIMKDANVILECHPRLISLFRQTWPDTPIFGTRKAISIEWNKNYKIDYKLAIGSLGKHYRKKKEDFPGTPYLKIAPHLLLTMKEKLQTLSSKPKIGISWKGGIGVTNKAARCLPMNFINALSKFDVDLISLQYHSNAQHEVDVFNEQAGATVINHWQDVVDDYDLTAALLMNLDLVISIPQSVVHLAGALGIKTYQLCPVQALWQMGPYGEDMPWYKSVRNFWQPTDGDWAGVCENVCEALKKDGYKCL